MPSKIHDVTPDETCDEKSAGTSCAAVMGTPGAYPPSVLARYGLQVHSDIDEDDDSSGETFYDASDFGGMPGDVHSDWWRQAPFAQAKNLPFSTSWLSSRERLCGDIFVGVGGDNYIIASDVDLKGDTSRYFVRASELSRWIPELVLDGNSLIPLDDLLLARRVLNDWMKNPFQSRHGAADAFLCDLQSVSASEQDSDADGGSLFQMWGQVQHIVRHALPGTGVRGGGLHYPPNRLRALPKPLCLPPSLWKLQLLMLFGRVAEATLGLRSLRSLYEAQSTLVANDVAMKSRMDQESADGFPSPLDRMFRNSRSKSAKSTMMKMGEGFADVPTTDPWADADEIIAELDEPSANDKESPDMRMSILDYFNSGGIQVAQAVPLTEEIRPLRAESSGQRPLPYRTDLVEVDQSAPLISDEENEARWTVLGYFSDKEFEAQILANFYIPAPDFLLINPQHNTTLPGGDRKTLVVFTNVSPDPVTLSLEGGHVPIFALGGDIPHLGYQIINDDTIAFGDESEGEFIALFSVTGTKGLQHFLTRGEGITANRSLRRVVIGDAIVVHPGAIYIPSAKSRFILDRHIKGNSTIEWGDTFFRHVFEIGPHEAQWYEASTDEESKTFIANYEDGNEALRVNMPDSATPLDVSTVFGYIRAVMKLRWPTEIEARNSGRERRFGELPSLDVGSLGMATRIDRSTSLVFGAYRPYQTEFPVVGKDYPGVIFNGETAQLFYEFRDECPELYVRRVGTEIVFYALIDDQPVLSVAPLVANEFDKLARMAETEVQKKWPASLLDTLRNPIGVVSVRHGQRVVFGTPVLKAWQRGNSTRLNLPGDGAGQTFTYADPNIRLVRHELAGTLKERNVATFVNPENLSPSLFLYSESPYYLDEQVDQLITQGFQMRWDARGEVVVENDSFFIFTRPFGGQDIVDIKIANHAAKTEFSFPLSNIYLTCVDRGNAIICRSPDDITRMKIEGKGSELSEDKRREMGANINRQFGSMFEPLPLANGSPLQIPETLSSSKWGILALEGEVDPANVTLSVPRGEDGHLLYTEGDSVLDAHLLLVRTDSDDGKFLLIEGQPGYISALRLSLTEQETEAEDSSFNDYQYSNVTGPFHAIAGDHIYEVGETALEGRSERASSSVRNVPMAIYIQKGNSILIDVFPVKGISIRVPEAMRKSSCEACIQIPAVISGAALCWLAQENMEGSKAVINASGRAQYTPRKNGDPEAFVVFTYEIDGNKADLVIEGPVEAIFRIRRILLGTINQKSRAIYQVLGFAQDPENLAHLYTVQNQLERVSPYAWEAMKNARSSYGSKEAQREMQELIDHAGLPVKQQSNGERDLRKRGGKFYNIKATLWFASKVDNKRGLLEHVRLQDWTAAADDVYTADSENDWPKHIDATRERAIVYSERRSSLVRNLREVSTTFVPNIMMSVNSEAWITPDLYYKNSAKLLMHAWAMWTTAESLELGRTNDDSQNQRFLMWAKERNPDLQALTVNTDAQIFTITINVPLQKKAGVTQYGGKIFNARLPLIYTRPLKPHYAILKIADNLSVDQWEQFRSEGMSFDDRVLFIGKLKLQQAGDADDLSTDLDEGIRDQFWMRHYSDVALDDYYLPFHEIQTKNPRDFSSVAENGGIAFDELWGAEDFTTLGVEKSVTELTVLFQGRRNYLSCCRDSANVLGFCSPEGKMRLVFFSADGKILPSIKRQIEQQMAQIKERISTVHLLDNGKSGSTITPSKGNVGTEIHEIQGNAANTTLLLEIPKDTDGRLIYEDISGFLETGEIGRFVLRSTDVPTGGYCVIQGPKAEVSRLHGAYTKVFHESETAAFFNMGGRNENIEIPTRRDFNYTIGSPGIFGESLQNRTAPMVLVTKPNSHFTIDDLPPGGLGFDISNAELTADQYANLIQLKSFLKRDSYALRLILPPMDEAEVHINPDGFEYRDSSSRSKFIAVFRCEITDWSGVSPVTKHSDIFIRGGRDDIEGVTKDIQRQINEVNTEGTLIYRDLNIAAATFKEKATLDALERKLRFVPEECNRVLLEFGAYAGVSSHLRFLNRLRERAYGVNGTDSDDDVQTASALRRVRRLQDFIDSCDYIKETKERYKDISEIDWSYGQYRWTQEHHTSDFRDEEDEFNWERVREMTNMAAEACVGRLQFEVFSEKAGSALMREFVEPHRHQTLLMHDLEYVLKADKLSRLSAYLNQGNEDAKTSGTIALIEARNPKIKSITIDYQKKALEIDLFQYVPLLFNVDGPVRMKPHFRGEFKHRSQVFETVRKALPELVSLSAEDIRSYDWDAFFKMIVNVTPLDLEEDTNAAEEAEKRTTGGDVFNAAADALLATKGEDIADFIQMLNKRFPHAGQAAMYVGGALFAAYCMGRLGAAIGAMVGGPPGAAIGAGIGATIGAGVGALGAYSAGGELASGGGQATTVAKGVSDAAQETLRESGTAVSDLGGLWGAARDASEGWTLVNAAGNLLVAGKSAVVLVKVKGGYLLASYGTALNYAGKTGKVVIMVYASNDCVEGAGSFLESKTMGTFFEGAGKCAVAFSTVMGVPGMSAAQAKLAENAVAGSMKVKAAQALQAAIDLEDKAMASGMVGILFGTVTKAGEEAVKEEEKEIYQEIVAALEQHDKEIAESEAQGMNTKIEGERYAMSPEKLRLLEYSVRSRSKKRLGSSWKYSRLAIRGH